MTVGERIKQRRLELDMSQDELAKKVGYKSRSSVQKIESARNLPLDKVEKMAYALECSPSYLMGWEEPEGISPAMKNLLDVYVNQRNDSMLLELYHNASEKDQAMVRYILGYKEPDDELPQLKNKKD